MKPVWRAGAAALFSLVTIGSALADKASDTLNLAFPKDPGTTDAYFSAARESVLFRMAVWDGLVYRDEATGDYKGNLATEWRWVDDKTLEFKLRQGVKFHNGDDFTADDVVYTVNYMIDPAHHAVAPNNVDWMTGATKIDPYTVRITTKGPFPAALEYLAGPVVIYPHEYYAKVGPSGMGLKPVGTGPYQVVTVEPGKHYVLKRFAGYHGASKPKAAIGTIDIRTIPDINTQVAELFSGGLDLVWGVPDDQAEKIKSMDQFAVVNGATMRIGYINMDAASRGGSGDNPFAKLEVRQAVAHAIDRKSIVTNLVKGSSEVLNAACYPTQFGCTQDVTAYAYDPAAAKALLAKAGYPNGFTTDFYAYRDQPLAEAMMADLAKIGITAKLKVLQYPALRDMQAKGGAGFAFMTWGSNSINDVSAITGLFFRGSDQDFAHDDQVKAWLEAGDTTVDPAARKENYTKALKRIADQAYWLPLFSYNTNYVFSKEVDFTPTPDEIIRFYSLKWK